MHQAQPTRQQLQAALVLMRQRPVFAAYPADIDAAMADPWRARLITLTSRGLATGGTSALAICGGRRAGKPTLFQALQPRTTDIKRAAAGDRDD